MDLINNAILQIEVFNKKAELMSEEEILVQLDNIIKNLKEFEKFGISEEIKPIRQTFNSIKKRYGI